MSYILDALKKIEHEKNSKRLDGRISIAGDMFQDRKQPVARVATWKIVLLILVASLVTSAGTWFVLKGNSTRSAATIRPVVSQVTAPLSPPVALPIIPVTPSPQLAARPAAPSTAIPAKSRETESDGDFDATPQEVRRSRKNIKTQIVIPKQSVQTVHVQAPVDIKLSGIAWQDERSARWVVINGFLLKEGAVVSGAKITDIQADRVRFSSPAGLFVIRLDAVLPAEVK